jgi:RecA-family ATPase
MFERLPLEMRQRPQWVVWKAEMVNEKLTKVPYNPRTGYKASSADPSTWATFDEAKNAAPAYSGIGYEFAADDPYSGLDVDNPQKDPELVKPQAEIIEAFASYTEISPGGFWHIIVKGKVPTGVKRPLAGIYSFGRFFTMTGNAINENKIEDRQELLTSLWKHLGGNSSEPPKIESNEEQKVDDEKIIEKAIKSFKEKFKMLNRGEWSEAGYPSPSEADQAFMDYLQLCTKNKKQLYRIYYKSALGQIPKDKYPHRCEREDYVKLLIKKSFDQELPPIDFTELKANLEKQFKEKYFFQVCEISNYEGITDEEWNNAKLHPQVIVENYLYADVAVLIASGGVGKTTLVIYEAIHIILGLPLYGKRIKKPGPVMIITAEDSREQIIARASRIAAAMKLFDFHIEKIKRNLFVWYVGNQDYKLCCMEKEMVANSVNVDKLIETIKPLNLSLLNIDPAVSFSVGESRVNDAEQGLIRAARRIKDALNCCVRYIHHTSKTSGKEGDIDQYAGRGGSAMPDGARMVTVLKSLSVSDFLEQTGESFSEGAKGLILAFPKLSYTSAQPKVYLERTGFAYCQVIPIGATDEERQANLQLQIINYLREAEAKGIFHSKDSLESSGLGIRRKALRAALAQLEVLNQIAITKNPGRGQGRCIRLIEYSPREINHTG